MSARAPFIKSAAWSLAGRTVGITGAFVVGLCLARVMDPADLGAFFALQTTAIFLATIARGGLQQPIVKAVAEAQSSGEHGRAGKTLAFALLVVVMLGCVLIPLLYLGGLDWAAKLLLDNALTGEVKVALCVWIGFMALQTPIAEALRGLSRIGAAVLTDGTLPTVVLAIYLTASILLRRHLELAEAINAFSLATLLGVLWGAVSLYGSRRLLIGKGRLDGAAFLDMARSTFFINLSTLVFSSASIWICSGLLSQESTALYGVGSRLASLTTIPLLVMNMAVQPYIVGLLSESKREELEGLLRTSTLVACLPSAAAVIVFAFFGSEALGFLYGATYSDAAGVLLILTLGNFVNVITGSCGQVLIYSGHTRRFLSFTLGSGLTSVTLSSGLALWFGVNGAAIGQLIGISVLSAMAWNYARSVVGIRTHPGFDKRLFSGRFLR